MPQNTNKHTLHNLEELFSHAAECLDEEWRRKSGVLELAKLAYRKVNPSATQDEIEHFLFMAGGAFVCAIGTTAFQHNNKTMSLKNRLITPEEARSAVQKYGSVTKAAKGLTAAKGKNVSESTVRRWMMR